MKTWRMPRWMERYRTDIMGNGDPVEDLMNNQTPYQINGPLSIIAVGVKMQVGLLCRLKAKGEIK